MTCFKIEDTYVSSGELHRRLECTSGELDVDVYCEPRFGYGYVVPEITSVKKIGYSFSSRSKDNRQELGLLTEIELNETTQGTLSSIIKMRDGDKADIGLRSGRVRFHHSEETNTEIKLKETRAFWKGWADKCNYSGKWRDM